MPQTWLAIQNGELKCTLFAPSAHRSSFYLHILNIVGWFWQLPCRLEQKGRELVRKHSAIFSKRWLGYVIRRRCAGSPPLIYSTFFSFFSCSCWNENERQERMLSVCRKRSADPVCHACCCMQVLGVPSSRRCDVRRMLPKRGNNNVCSLLSHFPPFSNLFPSSSSRPHLHCSARV